MACPAKRVIHKNSAPLSSIHNLMTQIGRDTPSKRSQSKAFSDKKTADFEKWFSEIPKDLSVVCVVIFSHQVVVYRE